MVHLPGCEVATPPSPKRFYASNNRNCKVLVLGAAIARAVHSIGVACT